MDTTTILGIRGARATALIVALAAVLSMAFAGVAYAALVDGSNRDNTLTGTERSDVIRGHGGNDKLHGLGGTDVLNGGTGKDELYGGAGEDFLRGGGNDLLVGGEGVTDEFAGGAGYDRCDVEGPEHAGHNITGCEEVF